MSKGVLTTKCRQLLPFLFLEIGYAYGVGFSLQVALLARNRLILSVTRFFVSRRGIPVAYTRHKADTRQKRPFFHRQKRHAV